MERRQESKGGDSEEVSTQLKVLKACECCARLCKIKSLPKAELVVCPDYTRPQHSAGQPKKATRAKAQ